jgi:hypothetical protein
MDTSTNIDASFFLFLLQSNLEILGVEKTLAQLHQIGENIATGMVKQFSAESLSAKTFKEFKEKRNPLTEFDKTLEINDDMIFLLERCPFEEPIHTYLDIAGKMPASLIDLVKKYNESENGRAISPYCIIHQIIRQSLSKSVKINGKPCEILQLGCKGGAGMVSLAQANIKAANLTVAQVESKLQSTMCAYAVRQKK